MFLYNLRIKNNKVFVIKHACFGNESFTRPTLTRPKVMIITMPTALWHSNAVGPIG